MISNLAFAEAGTRFPHTEWLACLECGDQIGDTGLGTLACPVHGVLVARIVGHAIWEGEIVEVLHRSRAEAGRYVVRFEAGEHRAVRFEDLRMLAMRRLTWEEQGPFQAPLWKAAE